MRCACRLLHHNLQEAKRVVASPAPAITRFAEEQSPEQRDHIFDELNTLAVIYRKPSSSFTNAVPAHKEVRISVCHCETSHFEASLLLLSSSFLIMIHCYSSSSAMLWDQLLITPPCLLAHITSPQGSVSHGIPMGLLVCQDSCVAVCNPASLQAQVHCTYI